jgi:hypothetical protein
VDLKGIANNPMNKFFESERKRFFEPDAFFTQRVMAQLDSAKKVARGQDFGFWDIVPSSTRPVLALAVMLILCFVIVEMFIPQYPQRGMVESFLEPEQSPTESILYTDIDVPSQDLLQQLIEPED